MDTLRATGRIYHAKNLHSARSTSKAQGTEFQGASGHGERGEWTQWCTFVSRSDRNWRGVFKMRDLADLGQSSSSVNTTVLPQSSKTEENHNTERRNAEKVKMEDEPRTHTHVHTHIKTEEETGNIFSLLCWEVKYSKLKTDREIEDREIDGWKRLGQVVLYFSPSSSSSSPLFMLCW